MGLILHEPYSFKAETRIDTLKHYRLIYSYLQMKLMWDKPSQRATLLDTFLASHFEDGCLSDSELRIALDFDGVLIDDSSEKFMQIKEYGLSKNMNWNIVTKHIIPDH